MRIFLFLILLSCSVILSAQKRITLFFAGDLMQHQAQIDSAYNEGTYDYSDCFSAVKPLVSKADIAIANLEVTLGGKPYRGYPAFSAPDAFLYAIKSAVSTFCSQPTIIVSTGERKVSTAPYRCSIRFAFPA